LIFGLNFNIFVIVKLNFGLIVGLNFTSLFFFLLKLPDPVGVIIAEKV
jgi:hypothetical protein